MQTTFGGYPAQCTLAFSVQETLSKIQCQIEVAGTLEEFLSAEGALLSSLQEKYGTPDELTKPRTIELSGVAHSGKWRWSDTDAELTLASEYLRLGYVDHRAALTLENVSQAHQERASQPALSSQKIS